MAEEDLTSVAHSPPNDLLVAALSMLQQRFRENTTPASMTWNFEMIGRVGEITALVQEYRRAKVIDHQNVEEYLAEEKNFQAMTPDQRAKYEYIYDPKLYRDAPRTRRRVQDFPKRKGGFIDAEHSIEFHIGNRMYGLLDQLNSPCLDGENRKAVLFCCREVAELMDNEGIVLDQGMNFGNPTTMPHSKHKLDPNLHTSKVYMKGGFFDRLDKADKGPEQSR